MILVLILFRCAYRPSKTEWALLAAAPSLSRCKSLTAGTAAYIAATGYGWAYAVYVFGAVPALLVSAFVMTLEAPSTTPTAPLLLRSTPPDAAPSVLGQ